MDYRWYIIVKMKHKTILPDSVRGGRFSSWEDDTNVHMDSAACEEQAAGQVHCGHNYTVVYRVAMDNSPVARNKHEAKFTAASIIAAIVTSNGMAIADLSD